MQAIRQTSELIEQQTLSQVAALSSKTQGRKNYEEPCSLRTEFQRDRDRIIHSKAFRRLKHKTQVFLSPESDHYRTRLTHTLEVSQIARTIARALRLNEDLTEAIALGHDLGHTPFGHAGERALHDICGDFTHFEQSVRVCERLEKGGKGLNLTFEVLDGILHHTRDEWAATAEGRVVRLSDRVAYINHDIDDAVRAGVIKESDLPRDVVKYLGNSKSKRINTLVAAIINNSENSLDIRMDEETDIYYNKLHKFLFDTVYRNPVAKHEETKVAGVIGGIYEHLIKNPDKLTDEYALIRETDGVQRAAVDYIAGMTDHFAVMAYSDIYIPKFWKL